MYQLIGRNDILYLSKRGVLLESNNLDDIIEEIYKQNSNFTVAINGNIMEMKEIDTINNSIKFAQVVIA